MPRTKSDRIFQCIVILILTFCALMAVLPFVLMLAGALVDETAIWEQGYRFFPRRVSVAAYKKLLCEKGPYLLRAYGLSVTVLLLGTALHLLIAPLLAWPLARRDYPRRRVVTVLACFPLALSGGVVPWYLVWSEVFHIKDTIWAYILPNLVLTPWQVLLYRQYFRANIAPSLLDAAKLDGAGEWRIYVQVVLPLSLPILAASGLLTALAYWNDWVNGLYLIQDTTRDSLQACLMHVNNSLKAIAAFQSSGPTPAWAEWDRATRAAAVVLGFVPTLLTLPLLSRAYTRVIRLGMVKT